MSVGLTKLRSADSCADLIARADAALYEGPRRVAVR
jgi:PleD family two-component response regulator